MVHRRLRASFFFHILFANCSFSRGISVADADKRYESGGEVSKTDASNRIVGGWFSAFTMSGEDVVDSDNEVVDIPSYRKAHIEFSKSQRTANFDHEKGQEPRGTLIDNVLIDSPDFAKMLVHEITGMPIEDIPVLRLGHFGSFQIHDTEDFKTIVEKGAMFSIEGVCSRVLEEE